MKTEYLYEFKVLAENGNFQVAADKLFLSQSTLSKHIGLMENELGFLLVEHKTNKFSLTPEGVDFLPFAKAMCNIRDEYISFFMNRSETHLLDVGILHFTDVEDEIFSAVIHDVVEKYPSCLIRTSFISAEDNNIDNLLRQDNIQKSFCCLITKKVSSNTAKISSSITYKTLHKWPISILTRNDHHLAGKEVTFSELEKCSLISFPFRSSANTLTKNAFRDAEARPFFAYTVSSFQSLLEFVRNYNSVFVATEQIDISRLPDGFSLTPLSPQVYTETFVAYNRDFNRPFERFFLDSLFEKFNAQM